jgi:hypothetical protein
MPKCELETAKIQQRANFVTEETELVKSDTSDSNVKQSETKESDVSQTRVIQPAGQVIDFSTLPRAAVDSSRFKQ